MPVTMKNTAAGMRCCLVWYKFTNDTEECTASIFKVRKMLLGLSLVEALCFSKTFYWTVCHHIPDPVRHMLTIISE